MDSLSIFSRVANKDGSVLASNCTFSLEPLGITFSCLDEIKRFWETSESTEDHHPTIYDCGSTIIVESLRVVFLDSPTLHFVPNWESLRGHSVCVTMVSNGQDEGITVTFLSAIVVQANTDGISCSGAWSGSVCSTHVGPCGRSPAVPCAQWPCVSQIRRCGVSGVSGDHRRD